MKMLPEYHGILFTMSLFSSVEGMYIHKTINKLWWSGCINQSLIILQYFIENVIVGIIILHEWQESDYSIHSSTSAHRSTALCYSITLVMTGPHNKNRTMEKSQLPYNPAEPRCNVCPQWKRCHYVARDCLSRRLTLRGTGEYNIVTWFHCWWQMPCYRRS